MIQSSRTLVYKTIPFSASTTSQKEKRRSLNSNIFKFCSEYKLFQIKEKLSKVFFPSFLYIPQYLQIQTNMKMLLLKASLL